MNVYDFDGTIYDGDSSADFLKSLLFQGLPGSLLRVPGFGLAFIKYKCGLIPKERMKEVFFALVKGVRDIDGAVAVFWKKNHHKLKAFYYETKRPDDIIISASPAFLLEPVAREFGVRLLASEIDKTTGKYSGINCHGEEKIRRLKELAGDDVVVDDFYSDSLVDLPLARFAKRAFMVKGNVISLWKL